MQKTNEAYNLQISEMYNTKKQKWWVEVTNQKLWEDITQDTK